jgi:hypothetical protein
MSRRSLTNPAVGLLEARGIDRANRRENRLVILSKGNGYHGERLRMRLNIERMFR